MGTPLGAKYIPYAYMDPLGKSCRPVAVPSYRPSGAKASPVLKVKGRA